MSFSRSLIQVMCWLILFSSCNDGFTKGCYLYRWSDIDQLKLHKNKLDFYLK